MKKAISAVERAAVSLEEATDEVVALQEEDEANKEKFDEILDNLETAIAHMELALNALAAHTKTEEA